jgi:PEP-CTERM motif
MIFDRFFRAAGGAKSALTALAVLATFGLANPAANAQIALSWTAVQGAANASGSGTDTLDVAKTTLGAFTFTLSTNTTDISGNAGLSILSSTTIDISTTAAGTLDLTVSGQGFTAGAAGYYNDLSYAASGTSSKFSSADTTTAYSWADPNNGAFATTVATAPETGTPGPGYNFPLAGSPQVPYLNTLGVFSMTQELAITLGKGDEAQLTITTVSTPTGLAATPEPSSLVLGGLGALGMIGYGLRRRKALGA